MGNCCSVYRIKRNVCNPYCNNSLYSLSCCDNGLYRTSKRCNVGCLLRCFSKSGCGSDSGCGVDCHLSNYYNVGYGCDDGGCCLSRFFNGVCGGVGGCLRRCCQTQPRYVNYYAENFNFYHVPQNFCADGESPIGPQSFVDDYYCPTIDSVNGCVDSNCFL